MIATAPMLADRRLACCWPHRTLSSRRPARPAPAEQQPPITFKVEVNYVEIDASVTDAQGNFVRGLTRRTSRSSRTSSRRRSRCSRSWTSRSSGRRRRSSRATAIEPDVRSNRREFDGRVFVLVLDDLHTHFDADGAAARRGRGSSSSVTSAPTTSPRWSRPAARATARRTSPAAAACCSGRSTASWGRSCARRRSRSWTQLHAAERRGTPARSRSVSDGARLQGAAAARHAERGRRLPGAASAAAARRWSSSAKGIDYDIIEPASRTADAVRRPRRAASRPSARPARANVSIYAVDPRGLVALRRRDRELVARREDNSLGVHTLSGRNAPARRTRLRTLAEETGGFAAVNRNDYRETFARIIRDNSSYYVLGYYSTERRRDGRFREGRRARPAAGPAGPRAERLHVAPTAADAPRQSPGHAGHVSATLQRSAGQPAARQRPRPDARPRRRSAAPATRRRSLVDARDRWIPLHVQRQKGGRVATRSSSSMVAVRRRRRRPLDGGRDDAVAHAPAADPRCDRRSGRASSRAVSSWRPAATSCESAPVKPGSGSARLGAARPRRAGLLNAAPLAMSGIVARVGRPPPAFRPRRVDELLKDVLPGAPTTTRDFPRGDEIDGLCRDLRQPDAHAAYASTITTTCLADDGTRRVHDAERAAERGAPGRPATAIGHVATIPLKDVVARPVRAGDRSAQRSSAGAQPAVRELEFRVR